MCVALCIIRHILILTFVNRVHMNFKDPIYDYIDVEEEFEDIVKNPYFQRLNKVKQLALLYVVYPSAKHDQLTHSLGAYHLAKKVMDNKKFESTSEEKFEIKAAAMLHDVGHGPYSHLWENIVPEYDHEKITIDIINKIFKLPNVAKVIEKKHRFSKIISSVIDVDKLDYMARDSYFSGSSYGLSDTIRIVNNLSFVDDKLFIPTKAVGTVEHVLVSRNMLYRSVYWNSKSIAKSILLTNILKRAKEIKDEIYIDEIFAKMLENKFDLDDFLDMNDVIIDYHLQKWKKVKDKILNDLIKRFFSYDGFNCMSTRWKKLDVDNIKSEIAKNYDINYYFKEINLRKTIYEDEIYVQDLDKNLIELSKYSDIIKLKDQLEIRQKFIVGPKEIVN